jgi:hypothetical protein
VAERLTELEARKRLLLDALHKAWVDADELGDVKLGYINGTFTTDESRRSEGYTSHLCEFHRLAGRASGLRHAYDLVLEYL